MACTLSTYLSTYLIRLALPYFFSVKPLDKKCKGNGLLQKIDTLTSSIEEKNQDESGMTCFLSCNPLIMNNECHLYQL